jgi:hypothetical protein
VVVVVVVAPVPVLVVLVVLVVVTCQFLVSDVSRASETTVFMSALAGLLWRVSVLFICLIVAELLFTS